MTFAWRVVVVASMLAVPGLAAAGPRFVADPKAAVDCQAALVASTTTFAQKKTKQLDKCAAGAFKCIQTILPDFEAEVDPVERCLENAFNRCEKANEVIAAEEQKLIDAITAKCSGLDPSEVLRADGVGFEVIAPDCLDSVGITLSDLASVAECVMEHHECAVELLYSMEHPRAGELFDLVGSTPGNCLEDFGGGGEGVPDDTKTGRAVASCEQSVTKIGASFVGLRLKNGGKCLRAVFDCVQLSPIDGGKCLAKAQKTCDSAFAAIEKSAATFGPSVTKSCGKIPFEVLTLDTGVHYDALVENELCTPYGVGGILTTATHYATCLYRQHQCVAEEILKFSVPRAEELLNLVGRTLPDAQNFFCKPPDDEF